MKNLLLTISFALLSHGVLKAQMIVENKDADRKPNPLTIRNPVLFGDQTYTMRLNGWLTPFGYRTGAEFATVVSALPVDDNLPLDMIFRTGGNNLKNCLRIGYNSHVGVNSDDLPAQFTVTQYTDQSPANSTLFMARGGSSNNVKTFRLFTDAGDVLNAVLEGNMRIAIGSLQVESGDMVVQNGKLGVGVALNDMPGNHKLYIDGSVICTELTVDIKNNWPDYVFRQEYRVLPLQELESFIRVNGHLPNVPSATEIGRDGLKLGEMQRISMEKIEELTLYILQQQKEIEALKAAMNQLTQQNQH